MNRATPAGRQHASLYQTVALAVKKAAAAQVTSLAPAEQKESYNTGRPLQGELLKLVNDQYGHEVLNSEAYYACSAYFADLKLDGFAKYFRDAAVEERTHADKFFDFLVKCNVRLAPIAIPAAKSDFESPLAAAIFFLTNEQKGTADCSRIADMAIAQKDFYTFGFIQQFLDEQLEEVRKAEDLAKKVQLVQDDRAGLLLLDEQLKG